MPELGGHCTRIKGHCAKIEGHCQDLRDILSDLSDMVAGEGCQRFLCQSYATVLKENLPALDTLSILN